MPIQKVIIKSFCLIEVVEIISVKQVWHEEQEIPQIISPWIFLFTISIRMQLP